MREKTFSGETRVLPRKARAVIKRIMSARETAGGSGRIGMPCMLGAARMER